MEHAGCYCNTVYKRLTLLGGCAVITTRHVLTTATSTHLIMKGRYHYPHLEDILGVWYDTNHDEFNSSMYLTPAQIFYHPLVSYIFSVFFYEYFGIIYINIILFPVALSRRRKYITPVLFYI